MEEHLKIRKKERGCPYHIINASLRKKFVSLWSNLRDSQHRYGRKLIDIVVLKIWGWYGIYDGL